MKKIIKLIAIVLLICILFLVILFIRKMIVKNKILSKLNEYKNIKNYYYKIESISNGKETKEESWFLNNKIVYKIEGIDDYTLYDYMENDSDMWYRFFENKNGEIERYEEIETTIDPDEINTMGEDGGNFRSMIYSLEAIFNDNNEFIILNNKEVDGKKCYQIKLLTGEIILIDKETGLPIESRMNNDITKYSYRFNCVENETFERFIGMIE